MVRFTTKKVEKLEVTESGIQSVFLCTVCLMQESLYSLNTQSKRCTLFVSLAK